MNVSEEEAADEYRNSLVNFALQKISEEERGLVTLYYYDELDTVEISGITGISRSNIKVRLFRARQKMAEIIRKAEIKNVLHNE
jgi:RNA polymerase sigma-70 factor (ECF subfamily)